eukprot:9512627-Alexandrium_andersonii.AAC.1
MSRFLVNIQSCASSNNHCHKRTRSCATRTARQRRQAGLRYVRDRHTRATRDSVTGPLDHGPKATYVAD